MQPATIVLVNRRGLVRTSHQLQVDGSTDLDTNNHRLEMLAAKQIPVPFYEPADSDVACPTGAEILIQALEDEGVDTIFGSIDADAALT